MGNSSVFASLKNISAAYRQKLKQFPEEQFQTTPPIDGWSYSEVYCHILDLSLLTLKEVKKCIDGQGEDKPTALIVKILLFFGSFPPSSRYKVPKKLASRTKKITKTEASTFIDRFLEELEFVYHEIHMASPSVKTPHPRLGYLNAKQWFRFMEIHLKHHLEQLKRIEKSF